MKDFNIFQNLMSISRLRERDKDRKEGREKGKQIFGKHLNII